MLKNTYFLCIYLLKASFLEAGIHSGYPAGMELPGQPMRSQAEELMQITAHDLRNPLSCIQGYTGMLLGKEMAEADRAKVLQRILSCSRFMEQIIEDILDTAAIERGEIELKKGQVLLPDLLRKSLELLDHTAASRRVSLSLEIGNAGDTALADPARILQVVQNLVSNAVKHVPAESGRVVVRLQEAGEELIVEVADNGEGIAPEHLEKIFEKFFQADAERARGSLGLGLFIARQIVELHGGRLWARSAGKGRGASFYFSLPKFQPEKAYQAYKAMRRMSTPPPRRISENRIPALAPISNPLTRSFALKLAVAGALAIAAVWHWTPLRPLTTAQTLSASTDPFAGLRDAPGPKAPCR